MSYVVVSVAGSGMVYVFDDFVDSRRAMRKQGVEPKRIVTRLMRNGVKLDFYRAPPGRKYRRAG